MFTDGKASNVTIENNVFSKIGGQGMKSCPGWTDVRLKAGNSGLT